MDMVGRARLRARNGLRGRMVQSSAVAAALCASTPVFAADANSGASTNPNGSIDLTIAPKDRAQLASAASGGKANSTAVLVAADAAVIAAADQPKRRAPRAIETVVVQAQRTTEAIAREAQMQAPNLINIQTYETIRKLPDISSGEAVRRVPGVSLETDEGEGRYVNIRGCDADLNSTTFGGLRLPPTNNASPFGGYRAVTMDSIPIGIVGAITVTKSNTPSQDAEALCGTIEITPKTAPPGGAPFIQGNIGTGLEALHGTQLYDVAVTAGGRFDKNGINEDGEFSLIISGTYYDDRRFFDDVEPQFYFDAVPKPDPLYGAIGSIQTRDYQLHRKRHGVSVDFGWDPDENDSYYVRAFEMGYTERYRREFLNLTPDGNTSVLPTGQLQDTLNNNDGAGNSNALQFGFRDERETSTDRVLVAGGKNIFGGGSTVLDYRVGYTIGNYIKPYDVNSLFSFQTAQMAPAGTTITYDSLGPGHVPRFAIAGADYLNPADYQLTSLVNGTADNFDKEFSFATNLERDFSWHGNDNASVRVGASVRLRHKREVSQPLSYQNLTSVPLTSASFGGPETYYNGLYQNPPDVTPLFLQTMFGPGTIGATDVLAADQQFLEAREDVYAAYIQENINIGRLGVLIGARVENTSDHLHSFGIITTPGSPTPTVVPISPRANYTNLFPSLQFRYEIEPDLIARATYSSTIARPGFNQSSPALALDLGSGIATVGNPDLRPTTSNSFDVSIEEYLEDAGILSLTFFDKELTNYIVPNVEVGATLPPSIQSILVGGAIPLKIFTFTNAGPSYARGVEFNWVERFDFLPDCLDGLGASFNLTYVDSRYEIRPGEHSLLPSTSPLTWNAALFYEKGPWTLRLAAYAVAADLFGISGSRSSDIYNTRRTSMDFGSGYALDENLVLYFNAKNLLNTPHAFFQGTSDRPIQREFYGQTYQFGVRFDY